MKQAFTHQGKLALLTESHMVLLFHTTHETMHAESVLKQHHLKFRIVPRPRDIQDDCGLGLVILRENRSQIETILLAEAVYIKAAFQVQGNQPWIRENYPPAPTSYESPSSD
jgi:hypothetical protein